ncbi:hypothetical protein FN846DRAFT_958745 [Sphaerosporella brunnea]|uniref:Uncharacterized protein n=1 Tax=Sphaerosporella brunnea TaxID=1250544 RepID=A0A5J5ER37_9PEZI|nr:hypothetical protein FN846DRAFT_958745 [Sphaerosporella brunnea]
MDISSQRARTHIPIPLLGESIEESRYQECLRRIQFAHSLYLRRKESPEAANLYRNYVHLHVRWLAEQHAAEEGGDDNLPKSVNVEGWTKFWRGREFFPEVACLYFAADRTAERLLLKTGQLLSSPASVQDDPGPEFTGRIVHPRPTTVPPCSTPCLGHDFHDDGAMCISPTGVQQPSSLEPPGELSLSEQIRQKALSESSFDAIQVAQGVPCSSQELWPTPIFPPLLVNHDLLFGGQVLRIVSHMPWESQKFLYCIEWKPHDVEVAPLFWWVKLCGLVHHHVLVHEYHQRHRLEPPKWPHKKRVKSSAGLGVREIRRALDERKVRLILTGSFNEDTAVSMANERWMMRDEWQRRGRGWGAAKEIVQRRRNEWLEADHSDPRPGAGDQDVPKTLESLRLTKARILRQRSEPDMRRGSANGERGLRKKFSVQDELEWREHFGQILLPNTRVDTPGQLRSRAGSIRQRARKVPIRTSSLRHGPITSSIASLAPSENGSLASSQMLSDKGLLSSLLQKLAWGRSGRYLGATECIAQSPKVGFDGSRTPAPRRQPDGLDGPQDASGTAASDGSPPTMKVVDTNLPFEITRSQTPKKVDSLYSFPGYELCPSSTGTLFQYKPSSSLSASSGENIAMKSLKQGQHPHHHRVHRERSQPMLHERTQHSSQLELSAPQQPPLVLEEIETERRGRQRSRNRPQPVVSPAEGEVDHERELWLDGTLNRTRPHSPSSSSSSSSSRDTIFSSYPDCSYPASLDLSDIDNPVGNNSPVNGVINTPSGPAKDGADSYCVVELPQSNARKNTLVRIIGRESKEVLLRKHRGDQARGSPDRPATETAGWSDELGGVELNHEDWVMVSLGAEAGGLCV